jgi:hypothetical protein
MATNNLINPTTFLDPATLILSDLLSKNNFLIPDYQRDYSWTEEEVEQLIEDLAETAKRSFSSVGQVVPHPIPHFIGAIVLQTFPDSQSRTAEVIDGQQRLVTLTALISVLCEFTDSLASAEDRDSWTASLKQLLYTNSLGNKVPRLTLSRDNDHYQEIVCNRHRQIDRENYFSTCGEKNKSVAGRLIIGTRLMHSFVEKFIVSSDTTGRDQKVLQIIKSLLQLTVVLQMKVYEQGVAYEVFENLNARGLELQQADLLKNKLYALAETQGTKSEVVDAWLATIKAIEQQSMITVTEFFYFHLISKHRDLRLNDLYKQVLAHVETQGNNARDYMLDVARTAEALQQMLEAGTSFTPEFSRDIISIKDLITNKYALTLLISGINRYQITSNEMAKLVKLTHHYVFRRFVIEELSLSKYAAEITRIARDFSNGTIRDLAALSKILKANSQQAIFEAKLMEFSANTNKLGFYIIEMIENHQNKNAGTLVQRQSINQHLEHVMPKKPTIDDWPSCFNDPRHSMYVNKIGNLLVLEADKNQYIKNKGFKVKNSNAEKKDYENSKLSLPSTLKNYLTNGEWTFESIEKRQRDLVINHGEKIWTLEV